MIIERKARLAGAGHPLLTTGLNIKSLNEDGVFAGYASVFDVVDNQRDIVLPGAFKASLAENRDVKLLWQHQFDEPIGVIDKMFEDARGLYVECRLLMAVAKAREVYALLKSGAINGMSIGYTPVKYAVDPDSGVRKLSQIQLWEISLVTFPANQAALVTVVKSNHWEAVPLIDALDRAIAVLA